MRELEPGEVIFATFAPRRTGDLKPGTISFIGRLGAFEVLWRIEDGDYAGEFAMRLPASWQVNGAIWVPNGDLTLGVDGRGGTEPQASLSPPGA